MADFSGGFWMERTIGASAGAAVSLIYMLPADRREAACRFVAGLVSGLVFGGPAGVLLAGRLGIATHLSAAAARDSRSAMQALKCAQCATCSARNLAPTAEASEFFCSLLTACSTTCKRSCSTTTAFPQSHHPFPRRLC